MWKEKGGADGEVANSTPSVTTRLMGVKGRHGGAVSGAVSGAASRAASGAASGAASEPREEPQRG